MNNADYWLDAYAESHQNRTNKVLHYICVPMIVVSVIGILWTVPVPQAFMEISPALNWGTCFLLTSVVYYFIISVPLAIGMLPFVLLITMAVVWLDSLPWSLLHLSAALFVIAWVGQFIGHRVEGKKPKFLEDLQFLMIGPLWMLAALYKRFGVRY